MLGGAGKGAAALTAALSTGVLRGWHGDRGVASWETCLRGIGWKCEGLTAWRDTASFSMKG